MKIAVVGTGYVGLSNAMIFAQHHEVIALDIIEHKVEQLNQKNHLFKILIFLIFYRINL